jgi:hypothetical protein
VLRSGCAPRSPSIVRANLKHASHLRRLRCFSSEAEEVPRFHAESCACTWTEAAKLNPECKVSNPAAPASQSGLHRPTSEDPSKRRGTATFRRYHAVSVSGIGLQKRRSGPWSLRPTFWCLVFAEPITLERARGAQPHRNDRGHQPATAARSRRRPQAAQRVESRRTPGWSGYGDQK